MAEVHRHRCHSASAWLALVRKPFLFNAVDLEFRVHYLWRRKGGNMTRILQILSLSAVLMLAGAPAALAQRGGHGGGGGGRGHSGGARVYSGGGGRSYSGGGHAYSRGGTPTLVEVPSTEAAPTEAGPTVETATMAVGTGTPAAVTTMEAVGTATPTVTSTLAEATTTEEAGMLARISESGSESRSDMAITPTADAVITTVGATGIRLRVTCRRLTPPQGTTPAQATRADSCLPHPLSGAGSFPCPFNAKLNWASSSDRRS